MTNQPFPTAAPTVQAQEQTQPAPDASTEETQMTEQLTTEELKGIDRLVSLTDGMELSDTVNLTINTIQGVREIPVTFIHWEEEFNNTPERIRAVVVGEPAEWAQPVTDKYAIKDALNAVAKLHTWETIDPDGALLTAPWAVFDNAFEGSFGFVTMDYKGELELPNFGPRNGRRNEEYLSAWGEVIKSNGVAQIGFRAVKDVASSNISYKKDDYIRAQQTYNQCSFTIRCFGAEGGATIWLKPWQEGLGKYFYLLWNLRNVNPELADELARAQYNRAVARKRHRKQTQKQFARNAKAEENGQATEVVTQIGDVVLKEGVYYEFLRPGQNQSYYGFRHREDNPSAQADALVIKRKVETQGASIRATAL